MRRAAAAAIALAACGGHADGPAATVSADRSTVVTWDAHGLQVARGGATTRVAWQPSCGVPGLVALDGAGTLALVTHWTQHDAAGATEIHHGFTWVDRACLYDLTGAKAPVADQPPFGPVGVPETADDPLDRRWGAHTGWRYPGQIDGRIVDGTGAQVGDLGDLRSCDVTEHDDRATVACTEASTTVVVLDLDTSARPPKVVHRDEYVAATVDRVRISRDGTTVAWTDGTGGAVMKRTDPAPVSLLLDMGVLDFDFTADDDLVVLTARKLTRYRDGAPTKVWHVDFAPDRVWSLPDGRILVSSTIASAWLR